jgi:purine-nucleoside phosphorylase
MQCNLRNIVAKSFNKQMIMIDWVKKTEEAIAYLKSESITQDYTIGVIMGTGLESMAKKIEIEKTIPYVNIPGFATATVSFHKGNLLFGSIAGKKVVAMQGRFHYYEGYSMQQITFPIRVLKALGVQYLLLSNAAGGMNPSYQKGDLMLIDDHINMQPDNPLRGLCDPQLGERFVDMCQPYSNYLNEKIMALAIAKNIILHKGIYVAVMGPNLETRAEYRWLRGTGADVVGMSTVPEVIIANQVGIQCVAISVVTDECNPDNLQPVNIAEIIAVAGKADTILSDLYVALISSL